MEKNLSLALLSAIVFNTMCEQEQAPKGARIEASFIIQNKHNALLEHMQKVKKQLEEAHINKKKLQEEREIIDHKLNTLKNRFARIQNKVGQSRKASIVKEEQEKLFTLLSMLDIELAHACLLSKLYPQYRRELDLLSLSLSKCIAELNEQEPITYTKIRSEVDRAFLVKDKVETEGQLMDLIFELKKQKVYLAHKQRLLPEKQQQLYLLQDEINREGLSKKRVDLKIWLKKQIGYLKRTIPKIQKSIRLKEQQICSLKEKAIKLNSELYKDKHDKENWLVKQLE